MPTGRRRGAKLFQPSCDLRFKLDRPAADRPIAPIDSARGNQLFNFTKAEAEAKVELHSLTDHRRREAMALEG